LLPRELLEHQVSLEDQEHKVREEAKDPLDHKDLLELEEYLVELVVKEKMVKLVLLVTLYVTMVITL